MFFYVVFCFFLRHLVILPLLYSQNTIIHNVEDKLPQQFVNRSKTAEILREEEIRQGKRPPYKRIFLKMMTSVVHEENLPFSAPEGLKFEGDYESISQVSYVKKDNILRFKPQKEGEAVLRLLNSEDDILLEYRIEVMKNKLEHQFRDIVNLLSEIDGIDIKIMGNKIVIDGQVLLVRDLNRVNSVIAPYGETVVSLVTVAPNSLKKIAELISREINNPDIEVRSVENSIILQGTVSTDEEKVRAETIAKLFIPDFGSGKPDDPASNRVKLASMIVVRQQPPSSPPPPKMIQVVVHFVELIKDYRKGFLFSFMPELGDNSQIQFQTGTGVNQGSQTTITGVVNNLFPKLNWGKAHGYARVLKSGSLLVQDTKTGTMRTTFRVPDNVVVGANGFAQQTLRDVGFVFTVNPVIFGERSDLINLNLKLDIASNLTTAQGVTNNIVETDVAIRSGQSAAIAGLIQNQSTMGYNKKQNPGSRPLITLHADREFVRDQSQYVLFVTPVIKSSASQGVEKIKKRFSIGN